MNLLKRLLQLSFCIILIVLSTVVLSSCSKDSDTTTGPVDTYNIQGKIVDGSGNGIEYVTITVNKRNSTKSDTTSTDGSYNVSELENGEYILTPSKLGYTFTPENITITIKDSDLAVQTIVGSFQGFTVSGTIVNSTGAGVPEIIVKMYNANYIFTQRTNSEGKYSIYGIANGSCIIIPSKVGYVFEPESWEVTVNNTDLSISNITGTFVGAVIEGQINHPNNKSVEGISVVLSSETYIDSVKTDSDGKYKFDSLIEGKYILSPYHSEYLFEQKDVEVTINEENWISGITVNFWVLVYEDSNIIMASLPASNFEMSITEVTNVQYTVYLLKVLALGSITISDNKVIGTGGQYDGQLYLEMNFEHDTDNKCWISFSNGYFIVASGKENWPVVAVTYYGAIAFAEYYGFDLPTEEEWEYAARGGYQHEYGTNDGTISSENTNYNNNVGHPSDVGSYPPNPYGLYDMSGNVWERTSAIINDRNILRGGSWANASDYCHTDYRYLDSPPGSYSGTLGFRVVHRP